MRLRLFTEPQMGATYDDQLALAQLAEECGFDAFFRSDHYVAFSGDGLPGPTDSWVTLAGLARETTRIRLGTLVSSCTFRWPGLLAIAVAEVDAMSGGRVELGLGTGWFDGEHRANAVPFPPLGERFEQLEEQLEIVTGMWSSPVGEHFSYGGRHFQVVDSPGLPKPVQSPRPPIIVGGFGPRRTPRLAARYADECNVPFHRVQDTGTQFDRVRAACEAVGRDPASLMLSTAQTVCCGRDEAEVERRAAVIGRSAEDLRENAVAGTPAEVVERCRQLEAVGASTVYLQVLDLADHDHVRLLGAEVLSALAG